jgi:thiamine biosynthesis lipoprotein
MRRLAAALAIVSSIHAAGSVRIEQANEAMGTTFSIVLYGTDKARLEAAAAAAFKEVHRLDRLLSNYLSESEWSRVNRFAGQGPVKVSAELFQLLSACLEYSRESAGAFDVTVGPLMKAWGFYRDEGRLPRKAELAAAVRHTGYRHVRLDRDSQTVQLDSAGVELDPGGIGKGYAVDCMAEVLRKQGVAIALISAGGSSIYGLGAPPEEPEGWRIEIRAPHDPKRTAATVFLKNLSLSTSGGYEKFFWAKGRRYAHIMDPRTGYPARRSASVSVVAPRTIDSEAWTKPYFVEGRRWTAAHRQRDFRVFFCEDTTRQTCEWIP